MPPEQTSNTAARLLRRSRRLTLNELIKRYSELELATLVVDPPEGDQWIHEVKFDGFRLLGLMSLRHVQLRTRNGKDWTDRFSAIAASLEKLPVEDIVVDMEAVVMEDGKSSFQKLQHALGEGGERGNVVAYVFDLLHLDGEDLTRLPLLERKARLKKVLHRKTRGTALFFSDHVQGNGKKIFAEACRMGLEGIISKEAGSPYRPGRQKAWLKTKCTLRQEFIILGYSQSRSGPRAVGALYLGYRKGGQFRYAGKVGTGFTLKSAEALARRFASMRSTSPAIPRSETGMSSREYHAIGWIKPSLMCEVAFTEWTHDGRVRHPSFQGLREDKEASEVRREVPMPTRTTPAPKDPVFSGTTITHPDRVISEVGNITKGQLAEYYDAVSPFILPTITNRPLSLLRCPTGVNGDCFYQRNPGKGLGADVHPFEFRHKGKVYQYLYIDDAKGLLELIQMGVIEIHPWGAKVENIDYPDRMIFDLDPAPDVAFEAVKQTAMDLRERLKKKGLESTLKCTGGKGLHVTVPLAAKNTWPEVKSFAASVADKMVADSPDSYVATMSKAKRKGKIFVDYFRNDYTATAIADYAVRARPGAPVALPLDWKELDSLESADRFTIRDVLARLKRRKPRPMGTGQTL